MLEPVDCLGSYALAPDALVHGVQLIPSRRAASTEIEPMTAEHPPEAMGALIRETFRAMVECVEHQFDDADLVLSQWLALKLIGAGTITCVSDVSRELGIATGASTRLVDQLENFRFLMRRRSATDRRVVEIMLTKAGKAVVEEMQPRLARFWSEQLDIFSDAERNLLFSMLFRLREKLGVDKRGRDGFRERGS